MMTLAMPMKEKNSYLKELATLYTQYEKGKDKSVLSKIRTLKQNKKQHPYNIELDKFIKKRKNV